MVIHADAGSGSPSPGGLSLPTNPGCHRGQSRRDCVLQPRVASLRATLGNRADGLSTPTPINDIGAGGGLWPRRLSADATPLGLARPAAMAQGNSFLATLGFVEESLRDSCNSSSE